MNKRKFERNRYGWTKHKSLRGLLAFWLVRHKEKKIFDHVKHHVKKICSHANDNSTSQNTTWHEKKHLSFPSLVSIASTFFSYRTKICSPRKNKKKTTSGWKEQLKLVYHSSFVPDCQLETVIIIISSLIYTHGSNTSLEMYSLGILGNW